MKRNDTNHLTPLTAPFAPNPFPYYRMLVAERPIAYDDRVAAWVAAGASIVEAILADDAMLVRPPAEPVPAAIAGTPLGEIFGRLVRMNDGDRHAERRVLVEQYIATLDDRRVDAVAGEHARALATRLDASRPETINAYVFDVVGAAMAELVGLRPDAPTLAQIHDFARAMSPSSGADETATGIAAARALLQAMPGDDADLDANVIGLLFQSHDGTAGLIAGVLAGGDWDDTPIHNTRRYATRNATIGGENVRAGDAIILILAAAHRDPQATRSYAFGAGRHGCPGERVARGIARAAVAAVERHAVMRQASVVGYYPFSNARVAILGEAR